MAAMTDFASAREAMVEHQLRARGIADPLILDAFRAVPRHEFVAPAYAHLAYEDHPLPIEAGQTISQPYIIALMIEAAGIKTGDRVLEVGAGSGYAAAVVSRIATRVIGIERQPDLAAIASERLARFGYSNVEIVQGDGGLGWRAGGPFDSIIASASGRHVPRVWVDQLRSGGSIVMPLGGPGAIQTLVRVTKQPDGSLKESSLCAVRFVPLIGAEGWDGC